MDLKNIKKPFHFNCPECGKEIELYPNDIERKYQKLKAEISDLKKQIDLFNSEYREDYKTNKWFAKCKQAYAHKMDEYIKVKQARSMLSQETDMQALQCFKQIVKANVGEELYIKWLKEAEDEIQYHTYDMAIQKYNKRL